MGLVFHVFMQGPILKLATSPARPPPDRSSRSTLALITGNSGVAVSHSILPSRRITVSSALPPRMLGFHANAWLLTTVCVPFGRCHPFALAVPRRSTLVMESLLARKSFRRIRGLRHRNNSADVAPTRVASSSAAFTCAADLKRAASSAGNAPKCTKRVIEIARPHFREHRFSIAYFFSRAPRAAACLYLKMRSSTAKR